MFVTTRDQQPRRCDVQAGLYGDGTASEDRTPQQWMVIALDRRTGKTVWERAYEGEPREKRHIKATYANATPATDGRYRRGLLRIARGVYAYDIDGKRCGEATSACWTSGAYDIPELRVGHGQLADHLQGPGDRAVRHAGRLVRDGART